MNGEAIETNLTNSYVCPPAYAAKGSEVAASRNRPGWLLGFLIGLAVTTMCAPSLLRSQDAPFHVEEASITDIQNAIRSGKTTCKQVVQQYNERAKAYNGACTALMTIDGNLIHHAYGMMRAGSAAQVPNADGLQPRPSFRTWINTKVCRWSLGKMITSASDPTVHRCNTAGASGFPRQGN